MTNPFLSYFMVKQLITARTNCPHCRHSFEVLKTNEPRITRCRICGKQLKVVSGKTYRLKKDPE